MYRRLSAALIFAFAAALAADVSPQSTMPQPVFPIVAASRALASNNVGLPVAATTTAAELDFVAGLTSAVQMQLNGKLPLAGGVMTGNVDLDGNDLIMNATGNTVLDVDPVGVVRQLVGGVETTRLSAGILDLRANDDGAAIGPSLRLLRITASPAASDQMGALEFYGRNLSAADTLYARMGAVITDATAGSEDSYLATSVPVNGALTEVTRVLGTGLRLQTKTASTVPYLDSNKELVSSAVTPAELGSLAGSGGVRVRLAADRTYYVATTGNDSNDCLTVGTPCLTAQQAVNLAIRDVDTGPTANVIVQLADGTYTGGVSMGRGLTGNGRITLTGNVGTPANVIISVTGGDAIGALGPGARLAVTGMEVRTTTSGNCLRATTYGYLAILGAVRFGACASGDMQSDTFGLILAVASYTIAGNAPYHMNATQQGTIGGAGLTVTLSGTPAFSIAFAVVGPLSEINMSSITYSGSATGIRYSGSLNGVLYTSGGGANYFPGNAAGSVVTGAQYN